MILENYLNTNPVMILESVDNMILQEDIKSKAKQIIEKIKQAVKKFIEIIVKKLSKIGSIFTGLFKKISNNMVPPIVYKYDIFIKQPICMQYDQLKYTDPCYDIKKINKCAKGDLFAMVYYFKYPNTIKMIDNTEKILNTIITNCNKNIDEIINETQRRSSVVDDNNGEVIDVDFKESVLMEAVDDNSKFPDYDQYENIFDLSKNNLKKYIGIDIDSDSEYDIDSIKEFICLNLNESAQCDPIKFNKLNMMGKLNNARDANDTLSNNTSRIDAIKYSSKKSAEIIRTVENFNKEIDKRLTALQSKYSSSNFENTLKECNRQIKNAMRSCNNILQINGVINNELCMFLSKGSIIIEKGIKTKDVGK